MNSDYEQLNTEEPTDDTQYILVIGLEKVGKKTLIKALQAQQKDDSFVFQNTSKLTQPQYLEALKHAQHILLVYDKHNLESLEKLEELMPEIKKNALDANLTLVENKDDELGSVRGIAKDPAFEGISFFVTTEEDDIQKFLKNQELKGVQCISVSAMEGTNIQVLWDNIVAANAQAQVDDSSTVIEEGEEARLISPNTEKSLLDKIDRFTTEYNSASAQIAHKLNQEHLGHINSLATILIAGVLSKKPLEFFERESVKRTLNEHLRALRYASPLSCQAISNLVSDTLTSLTIDLKSQFPYVQYLLQEKDSASMFSKRSPAGNAERLVSEVKAGAHHLKK